MPIDLDHLFRDMTRAAVGALASESRRARIAIAAVLEDQKAALAAIVAARLAGDIDDAEVKVQLQSERLAFRSGLAVARVAGKSAAQKAANAAFAVLVKALRAAAL